MLDYFFCPFSTVAQIRRQTVTLLAPYEKIASEFRIGGTDLVELPAPGNHNRIFAKLEYQNHTGSHYDRVYLWLLNELEGQGKISPETSTLVETTSGNAGISCAFIAQQRGYRCVIFTPAGLRPRCVKLMRQYGAEVKEVTGNQYVADARDSMRLFLTEHVSEKVGKMRCYYAPNHSQVEASCDSLEAIATEAIAKAGQPFNCFIGAAGNGCTLKGIGRVLKRSNPAMKVLAFDPAAALVSYQLKYGRVPEHTPKIHSMFGAGAWGIEFPHLADAVTNLVDDVLIVADEHWQQSQERLRQLRYEVGHTSSAAYYLACNHCISHANQKVLIIFYDKLDRY